MDENTNVSLTEQAKVLFKAFLLQKLEEENEKFLKCASRMDELKKLTDDPNTDPVTRIHIISETLELLSELMTIQTEVDDLIDQIKKIETM